RPSAARAMLECCSPVGRPRAPHSFPTRRSSDLFRTPAADDVRRSPRELAAIKRYGVGPQEFYGLWGTTQGATSADEQDGFDRWKDRKSTRLNSSHVKISYAVFCLKKKDLARRSM